MLRQIVRFSLRRSLGVRVTRNLATAFHREACATMSCRTLVGCHSKTPMLSHTSIPLVQQTRWRKKAMFTNPNLPKKERAKQEEVKKNVAEDEEDSDDEEEQVEEGRDKKYDEYFLEHFPDDRDLPDDYKEMVIILPHSRVDKILGKALGYPSKKIEEFHIKGNLQLNGLTLKKRSVEVDDGEYVDIILDESDPTDVKIQRVRIIKNLKRNVAHQVCVRIWKQGSIKYTSG